MRRNYPEIRGRYIRRRYIRIRPPKRSDKNFRNKIIINHRLEFGNANLVVAVPDDWIDVQTVADLEEVSFDLRSKKIGG